MASNGSRPALSVVIFSLVAFMLAAYFTFAAVQGDFGLFRRIQIEAEAEVLQARLEKLQVELAGMEIKTLRLSDDYLDLDLLDEQARSVLGYIRTDEIVIR